MAKQLADNFKLIVSGVFPDSLKHSKISPVFKTEDKCMVNYYRPISVLPYFQKFLKGNA